jgi:hypothetical protein
MGHAALHRGIFWLVLTVCCALAPPTSAAERRQALVIGNGAYRDAPLKNPVGDARAMAAVLRQAGFTVTQIENADRLAMQRATLAFGKALDRDAVGLFYYAGHGMQVRGINYLIPVGTRAESEDEVEVEAVDVNYVLARLVTAGNRLNIVILDACRDNPFARSFRSTGGGLASITAPTGTLIAYATAPGSTAADGDGANGLYTGELIAAIRQPGLRVEDTFKRTRMAVVERSRGKQTPWESSSLMGDFYFLSPPAVAASAPQPAVSAPPPPPAAPAPAPAPKATAKAVPAPSPKAAAVPAPAPQTAVAAVAPPPAAPAPARPMNALDCPEPGLQIHTSLGETLTAIPPNGPTCRWRNSVGNEYANVGPFLPPSFNVNYDALGAMRRLQLATVGAEERALEDGGASGNYTWSWRVAGHGPVTVPAGTFNAVLVEAVREGARGAHESRRRYWYVPDLRIVVKYQSAAVRGALQDDPGNWEVTEVMPPRR